MIYTMTMILSMKHRFIKLHHLAKDVKILHITDFAAHFQHTFLPIQDISRNKNTMPFSYVELKLFMVCLNKHPFLLLILVLCTSRSREYITLPE
jgi:hypothetical protein